MNDADVVYAAPENYEALIAALAARAGDLSISHADLDLIAGLASGYSSKILGPSMTKHAGPLSLFTMLPALGLRLTLTVDDDALRRYAQRGLKRNGNQARLANFAQRRVSKRLITRVQRYFGALGLAAQKKNRKAPVKTNGLPPARRRGARQQNGNGTANVGL